MAEPARKKAAATVLQNMTKENFAKVLRDLDDEHKAADDAAMSVAGAYKKMKKQGVHLDALRLVRKLHAMGSAVKVQAFLADFDRMRELAGFNDQLALFDGDKAKPQKDAEKALGAEGNVVQHPSSAKAVAAKAEKPAKGARRRKGAAEVPVPGEVAPAAAETALPTKIPEMSSQPSKAKLFAEGDEEVEEIADEVRAEQEGLTSGKLGEEYRNPHSQPGVLRDAWHKGWVRGSEEFDAEAADKKSA